MGDLPRLVPSLPPEQRAIQAKCFHPTGTFVEFTKEEVEQSIPERFEKIVRLYPDRIAVRTADQEVTYAELNAMANRLARAILAKHPDGKEPIALLMDNGIDAIASILGVLKAGQFFIPIDLSFPPERINSLLDDSQARLIVTTIRHADVAHTLTTAGRALLKTETIGAFFPSDNLGLPLLPEDFAAILYTSGSTGEPKGVIQNHRSLLHATMRRTNAFRISAEDRLILIAFSTYQAIMNIFASALNGARLCPFSLKEQGATRFASWLVEEQITIYHSSASLFRELAGALTGTEDLSRIRVVRLASETVTKADLDQCRKHFPSNCIFTNGLGSTETGMLLLYYIDPSAPMATDGVPIGYPLQDMEILLLGENGLDVGFNRVGEIAVKSRYLFPGYWRRPDLTQAKFCPAPEGEDTRLYLTGDLGKRSDDGCFEHLGRKDLLVKVRGFRVETGEVEEKLSSYPGIKEAVVIGRGKTSGDNRLVAYLVPTEGTGPKVNELRRFLKGRLPDYMIPSAFVTLDVMPRTPTGKLDRRTLPDPGKARPDLDTPFVIPETPVEERLAKIWAEVLSLDAVGIHDNFFDLGGHSLLASRCVSRLYEAFHVELPLRTVFELPTVAGLAGCVERVRREQQSARTVPIVPVSRGVDLPLSFSQEGLWFLDQLEPGSCAYNLCSAFQLTGRLNVTALEQSFNEIIKCHEALRTVFKPVNGQPLQTILPSVTINLPVADLQDIAAHPERHAEVRRLSDAEALRPFDLARGPLLRVTLLRLAEKEHVLLLTIHHIVFDGWSMEILARELSALYEAFSSGRPPSLPGLPIQYADFAAWQRHWTQGALIEAQLVYWKKQLESLPTLRLPTDRPRPSAQTARGARQSFALSDTLFTELRRVSTEHGVTLFMTLLAAYQTLLHRYTDQDDIVIGSPVAGRTRREVETLIGFFLNMVVLRADLSGNPTFRELLAQVREVCLAAYDHQNLPFEKLVEKLHPQRNLGHNPLFQVTFALQNTPTCSLKLAGLTAQDLNIGSGIARFDLHLFMVEDETGLHGWLVYNTDLFDASTIARLVRHFQMILEAIVANPEQRLSDVSLLTEGERHQLLVEWNDINRDYPDEKCIHQLFEAQVERMPDAVALVFEDRQLTYRELNRRANQLAHHLKKLGVGPEVLVGICLERSFEMIIGLLGILKAGGAYLPLDFTYPKERLAFMLQDSRVSVLLTRHSVLENLPKTDALVVCLDTVWKDASPHGVENPHSETTAANLAYVIYTSGSTGTPKGVEVPHRGIVRLLFGVEYVRLNANQTFLHLGPVSFDASTFEVWGALLHGAKCVLFPGTVASPIEFGEVIHKHSITILWLTASLFNAVIDQAPEALSGVRQLLIGGEALSVVHVRRALSLLPETQIINGYGPTESTTFTCCYSIPRQLDASVTSIPIGRPIANTEVYLLDPRLSPVPIGVAGELHIGGDGLARGYLNRSDLTAEGFIPHPFSDEPDARLYKTGDLARYLPDGNIEFLGRTDHLVKIRGFRIELGEIEAVLGQHLSVREAVVMAREQAPGGKRLVAYVVPNRKTPTISELRRFLKEKLPDYMVPSAFVLVDALLRTPNGKADRRALPAPEGMRWDLNEPFVAPGNCTETVLAGIWAKLLGLKQVGIHDNFFDLGGHSLLAVRLFAEIEKRFNKRLPLSSLFQDATIQHLASLIDQPTPPNRSSSLVAIQPQGSKHPFFCVHEFFGDVLCYFNLARHLGEDQPFYALQARGLDGREEPFTHIEAMAAHYIDKIRTVQPEGPYALGGLCFGGVVAFEMAQQLRAKGEPVTMLALLDSTAWSEYGRIAWWWSFLRNLPRDIPSWLIGSLQLNRAQWSSLIKLKIRMTKARVGDAFRSPGGGSYQRDARAFIQAIGDVFQFSEQHRRVAQAQYYARKRYKPQVYPGRVTLFRARMQPLFSLHNANKGWEPLAAGGLEIKLIPGNHLGMLQEPHVQVLADQLRACLDEAQTNSPPLRSLVLTRRQ